MPARGFLGATDAAAPAAGAGRSTVPGNLSLPASRTRPAPATFAEEQARHRAHARWATLACLLAAALAGLFLSLVLLLFAPITLGVLLGIVGRVLAAFELHGPLLEAGYRIATGPERNAAIAAAATVVILPVLLPPPLAWLWLRRLMLRTAATPWPTTIGVRAPRRDAEEHQFSNLVEEMAIAAELPAPLVGIIDAAEPNIAIFGTAHDRAGIVATRGALDRLDRAETQLLVAQAIGAIGNGDLRVSAALLAAYRMIALFLTLIASPLSGTARRSTWTLVRAGFGRADAAALDAAFAHLDTRLTGGEHMLRLLVWIPLMLVVPAVAFALVVDNFSVDKSNPLGALIPALLMAGGAAVLCYGLLRMTLSLWAVTILCWPLAAVWRARRFLADATAVRLGGDPDALAAALAHLERSCDIPEKAGLWSHQFLSKPRQGGRAPNILGTLEPAMTRRLRRLEALGAMPRPPAPVQDAIRAHPVRLGVGALLLIFMLSNLRFAGFAIAFGLGALLLLSTGAGLFLFLTIMSL